MTKQLRLTLAWIALFAILLGALAPTMTHLLGAHRGELAALADICSSASATQHSNDHQSPPSGHDDSCPFCVNHALAHAPPSSPSQWSASALASFAAPRLAIASVKVQARPTDAQARAPPFPA